VIEEPEPGTWGPSGDLFNKGPGWGRGNILRMPQGARSPAGYG